MLLLLLLLLLLLCVAVTLGPVPHGGVSQGGQQLETYCKSKQLKTKFTNYSTLFRKFCLVCKLLFVLKFSFVVSFISGKRV